MSEISQLTVFDNYDEQTFEVVFQDEVVLDVTMPLYYVNSGKKELAAYVREVGLPELQECVSGGKVALDAYVDDTKKPELDDYTGACKDDIYDYVSQEVKPHSDAAIASAAAALASETAAAASAAAAKQYRDEAEEIVYPTQATESELGMAEIATAAEVAAGTDDSRIITPLKAAEHYQSLAAAETQHAEITNSINALDAQSVKLTGEQSIAGSKTFTSLMYHLLSGNGAGFRIKRSDVKMGTVPSADQITRIEWVDEDNREYGLIETDYLATGDVVTVISPRNANNAWDAALRVTKKSDGEVYASCPTPQNAADNSEKVATTRWVNSRITVVTNNRTPNYTAGIAVPSLASASPYTAPADGMLVGAWAVGGDSGKVNLNINGTVTSFYAQNGGGYNGNKSAMTTPLKKGDTVYCQIAAGNPLYLNGTIFYPYY